ncbi:hypothetical protein [Tropicimonas sp. S265A]|uniref:hypothetical protein n=1 Tax=Tropicimonas sp. S265A TaxID=3415134 RepID=UPI003C79A265
MLPAGFAEKDNLVTTATNLFRLNIFLILIIVVSAVAYSTPYLNQSYRERVTDGFKNRLNENLSLRASRSFITCSGVETDLPPAALFKEGFEDCRAEYGLGEEQGIFLTVEHPEVIFIGDEDVVRVSIDRIEEPKSQVIEIEISSFTEGVSVIPDTAQTLKVREGEDTTFIVTTGSDVSQGDKLLSFYVSSMLGSQSAELRYAISQPPNLFSLSQDDFKSISQIAQIIGLPALLLLIAKTLVDWRKPKKTTDTKNQR